MPFIENKFSFQERPQYGIVVKGSSANKVALSSDNFLGVVQSHVMLAHVGQAVFPLEWVREDLKVVQKQGMPTAPGVYYIEILTAPINPGEIGYFAVDPLLTATDVPVLMFQTGVEREAQLEQIPVRNTLRLWENRNYLLKEGTDYTVNYDTGAIQLLAQFGPNSTLSADFRYAATSLGPIAFSWNSADMTTLPGVVLAFGKRAKKGDKVAVVVYQDRVDSAQAYGGKFEVSFDLEVIARDPMQMEEISDLVMMLWAQKKSMLEFEGIEIIDVSMGGESEDIADEVENYHFYMSSLSVQLRADWEMHIPLPLTISKAVPVLQTVASSVFFDTFPVIVNRNDDYERIG